MKKRNKSYSPELKRDVVLQVQSGELSLSQAARKYDVEPTLIRYWCKKADDSGGPIEAFKNKNRRKEIQLEREIEKLKIKLADQVMENDLLKKFSTWRRTKKELSTAVITSSNLGRYRKAAK